MPTLTGRERGTVTATGNFSGVSRIYSNFALFGEPKWEQNLLTIEITFLGAVIRFQTDHAIADATPPQTRSLSLSCYTGPGLGVGVSDNDSVTHDFDSSVASTWDWQEDLSSGTWTITAYMEEVLDVDGSDYPSYGGAQVKDPPLEQNLRLRDRTKIGTLLTVEADVAGMSVSASVTVDAARQVILNDYPIAVQVIAEGRGMPCSVVGVKNMTLDLGGNNAEYTGTLNVEEDGFYGIVDSLTGTVQAGCTQYTKKTIVNAVFTPRRLLTLGVGARAMEDAYPGTVRFRIDRARDDLAAVQSMGDDDTLSLTQRRHAYGASFWEMPGGGSVTDRVVDATPTDPLLRPSVLRTPVPAAQIVDEWQPFRMWVDADWIATQKEQENDWRVLLRGRPYSSFTLTQASEKTVSSTLTSATGASNLTLALPDGTTDSSLTGSSFTGASLRGYRYLRLRMKASAGETVTLTIGSKSWTQDKNGAALTLTTGYQDFDIDLCSPTSETASVDDTDTFYPIPTTDGEYWGVSSISSLVLSSISVGVTVDLESVKAVRDAYSRVTALQPFPEQWIPAGDTSEYPVRFLDGDTDGRRSLEGIHFYRTGSVYTIRSLTELIASLNGASGVWPLDGWSASAAGSFPDTFHTNALPACFAWGAGALYRTSAWSYGFDQSASGSLTVYAQALWDSVDWMPWAGDAFFYSSGGFGGGLQVQAAKILRSQIVGLVLGEDSLPASEISISVSAGADGTGTSQSNGGYQTGLPYPRGGGIVEVSANIGEPPIPSGNVVAVARRRERICFRVAPGSAASGCCLVDSDRGWLHIGIEAQVRTYNLLTFGVAFESEAYVDVNTLRHLRLDTQNARLYLLGVDGTDWFLYVSEDGGYSGSEVLNVTATSAVVHVDSERGMVSVLYENGAGIYRVDSDDGGDTWTTPVQPELSDAVIDGTLLDCAGDTRSNGAMYLLVEISGDTQLLRSEDMGETFSVILS